MRYIAKFDTEENLRKFAELNFLVDVKIKNKLNMVSFEFAADSGYTPEDVKQHQGLVLLSKNKVLSLDLPNKKKIEASVSATDTDSSPATYLGLFEGSPEYVTHLELLNSTDYASYTNLNKFTATKTGQGVSCFILDTGVNPDNYFLNSDNIDFTLSDEVDDNGHGTMCALLISSARFGVASDTTIYSLKVLDKNKSGSIDGITDAIEAVLEYKSDHSDVPCIVNMSLGLTPSVSSPFIEYDNTDTGNKDNIYLDSIKVMAANGIHVVMAAGNGFELPNDDVAPIMSRYSNGSLNLPRGVTTNYDIGQGDIVVVGSTNSASDWLDSDQTKMSYFSNYGEGNTINSIGGNLVLPAWNVNSIPEGESTDFYANDGTSFSAPIVTGLLALHLQENPTATPAEAKSWLVSNAQQNQISNLMKYIDYSTADTKLSWQGSVLKIERTSSNFTENFSNGELVQLSMSSDSSNFSNFVSFADSINTTNDGWWKITNCTNDLIEVEPNVTDNYTETLTTLDLSVSLKIAKITGTHEETDGIKQWQKISAENRLGWIEHDGDDSPEEFYITKVDATNNLVAFNPYQPYSINWPESESLNLDEVFDTSPFATTRIISERGEEVAETTFELKSGELPEGVTMSPAGIFTKQQEISNDNHDSVMILAKNKYVSFEKSFSVVGGDAPAEEDEPEDQLVGQESEETAVDPDDWKPDPDAGVAHFSKAWYNCDSVSHTLDDIISTDDWWGETPFLTELFSVDNDMCLVWSPDMPKELWPKELLTLTPGSLYYFNVGAEILAASATRAPELGEDKLTWIWNDFTEPANTILLSKCES